MSVLFAVGIYDKHLVLTQMTTTEAVNDGRGIDKDIFNTVTSFGKMKFWKLFLHNELPWWKEELL
jgi:hypothetical protein